MLEVSETKRLAASAATVVALNLIEVEFKANVI